MITFLVPFQGFNIVFYTLVALPKHSVSEGNIDLTAFSPIIKGSEEGCFSTVVVFLEKVYIAKLEVDNRVFGGFFESVLVGDQGFGVVLELYVIIPHGNIIGKVSANILYSFDENLKVVLNESFRLVVF